MLFETVTDALTKALIVRLLAGEPAGGDLIARRGDARALRRAVAAAWRSAAEEHRTVLAGYEANPDFFEHEGADEVARVLLSGRGPSAERLARAYVRAHGLSDAGSDEPLVAPFRAFLEQLVEELSRHAEFRTVLAEVAATRPVDPTARAEARGPMRSADEGRGRTSVTDVRRLFVVMPFGTRVADHSPERTLDFDTLYRQIIRPAAEDAAWAVERVDDVVAPGLISDQYLRAIVSADLVLADISIPNGNVYYELGVRHAVSAGGTLLIALVGTEIPFDLSMHRVLFYEATDEAWRDLRARIADALIGFEPGASPNPVRVFLERVGLQTSPSSDVDAFERDLKGRVERARNREQLIAVWQWARPFEAVPAAPLTELASRLADLGEWSVAADILAKALISWPEDFEIHRQRGWYLRQLGEERDAEVAAAFERALALNPGDPETLGMMAGRLKRLGDLRGAADLYGRASRVSPNSNYIAVNRAACQLLLDPEHPDAGTTLYRQLAERLLAEFKGRPFDEWDEIVLGEALFAIGDDEGATVHYATAKELASSPKALDSAADQLQLFERAGYRAEPARRLRAMLKGAVSTVPQTVSVGDTEAEQPEAARTGPIILHLSDVHFAGRAELGTRDARHRFYDGPDSQPLLEELRDELASRHASVVLNPERLHIVVSGDLAWTASEEEFSQSLELLVGLTKLLGVGKDRVHLVPGNHDVNWNLSAADRSRRLDNYIRLLATFYGDDLANQRYPFIKWPIKITDVAPAPHELIAVAVDAENGVLICGLNSCVLEDEQHHFGYVGRNQLRALKRHLAELDLPSGLARIAVMHHHLHPFPEYVLSRDRGEVYLDISVVRDAGVLERELEQLGFDLVLHGHKHKPQLRETRVREVGQQKDARATLIVCGAGSVSCTELEHAQSNHYETVEVLRVPRERGVGFARVVWRELALVSGAEWTTAQSWTIDG